MNALATPGVRPARGALPVLDLSGPALRLALESLLTAAEPAGGVDAYVQGLSFKVALFRALLGADRLDTLSEEEFLGLCTFMPTVRRRIGPWLAQNSYPALRHRLGSLLHAPGEAEARFGDFVACFPDDRTHRWVRDLAAEALHFTTPEDVPLMTRWMWDARSGTGVLREIWYGEERDPPPPTVPDRLPTFLALRSELYGFLREEGFFRDLPLFQDLLCAQVYAAYINDRGGTYLRADFVGGEDAMAHTRRLLGLDSLDGEQVRLRVKLPAAAAVPAPPPLPPERHGASHAHP